MEKNMYSLRGGFKKARTRKGITQAQVAEAMNVNLKTVMNWEQGISNPNLEMTMKLCELFECDLDSLAGRIKERNHDIKTACQLTGLSEAAIEKITKAKPYRSLPAKYLSLLIESDGFNGMIMAYKNFIDSANKLKESTLETPQYNLNDIETVVLSREQATRYFMRSAADAMSFLCEEEFRKQYMIALDNEKKKIEAMQDSEDEEEIENEEK